MVGALKNALGRALYENALDKGIAQTVYGQGKQRFVGSAVRLYPQLKRATKVLEFGCVCVCVCVYMYKNRWRLRYSDGD